MLSFKDLIPHFHFWRRAPWLDVPRRNPFILGYVCRCSRQRLRKL